MASGSPAIEYVDTHVHFWDRSLATYHWLDEEPKLPQRARLEDYRAVTKDHRPSHFIFVQAGAEPEEGQLEARWVADMCSGEHDFAGLIPWIPAENGPDAVRRQLDELALDSVVGCRRLIQWEPSGFCTRDDFVAAVASLAERDLVFDICALAHQLQEVAELVSRAPDTRFVIDHLCKPDIAGTDFSGWHGRFRALASFENVTCKLSGLVTEANHGSWTTDELRPFVDVALEAFGPGRIMWGSDWPVCTNASTHQRWRAASHQLLEALSEDEQAQIWQHTATEVYGLT